MIDSYSFGRMVVDGKEFHRDLKLFPSSIKPDWWRLEGHMLHLADMEDALKENPEVIIVGTGHDGCMEVDKGVAERCRESGIRLIALRTPDAVNEFNRRSGPNVIGLFHLTC